MLCLQKNRWVNRKLELKKKNCLRWSLHCLFTIAPPIIEAKVIHIWSTAFIHRAFPEIFSAAHQLWKEQTPRRYFHSVTTYPSLNEARAEPLAVDSGLTIIADVRGRQWPLSTGVSYIRLSAKAIKVILFVIIASYHWPGMVRLHYKKVTVTIWLYIFCAFVSSRLHESSTPERKLKYFNYFRLNFSLSSVDCYFEFAL